MTTKKSHTFLLVAVMLMLAGYAIQVTAAPLPAAVNNRTNAELAGMETDPDGGIRLKALDHTWSCASGLSAKTYQGQLDEKLEYIRKKAPRNGGKFMIIEDVSEKEALNTTGIHYMYANSELYREMAHMSGQICLASAEYTFSKLANQKTSYERWVFAAEETSTLNLKVAYNLKEGRMAVWLVSPEGEIVYQNEPSSKFDDNLKLDVDKGLWSIILVNHYDADYVMSGSKNIQGTLTKNIV